MFTMASGAILRCRKYIGPWSVPLVPRLFRSAEITWPDLFSRYCLYHCVRLATVSNGRLEVFQSLYVRGIGTFGGLSSIARTQVVRLPTNVSADGTVLGDFAGVIVYHRRRNLCGKCSLKPHTFSKECL